MMRNARFPMKPGWCRKHMTDSTAIQVPCSWGNHYLHVHEVDVANARKGRAPRYVCPRCHGNNIVVLGLSGHNVVLARWDGGAPALQLEMKVGGVK